MASVSYYSASKLEPNIEELNSEEMMHLLFDFNYDVEHTFSDENQDQDCYFDPDELFLPVENSCFMSEYTVFEKQQEVFQDNLITPSTHNSCFIPDYSVFESTPKRQKVFQEDFLPNSTIITPATHNSSFMPEYSVYEKQQKVFQDNCQGLFNEGFVPNPPMFEDFASYLLPEISMPVFSSNNAGVVTKKGASNNNNEKKMSAQSIAARQRRKKISDKTQELGKLIPGGHRMNTAEMLQATFKYIKLLQAQAGGHRMNTAEMMHLLFDFNYDVEHTFSDENQDQDCYFDPDEFILPVDNSCFMSEYSVFEKQQEVFQDNLITPSTHNSCFMPDYSVFESTPKRQKVFQDDFLPNSTIITPTTHNLSFMPEYSVYEKQQKVFQGLFNEGFVPNPPMFEDFASYLLPDIPMPVFSSNNAGVVAKKGASNNNNEKKMSAQSIAARQRRKKISDKTQELGKLIPGGHRMNTAEMLQATFKYIKLLQAQAGLLAFMGSYQESFETSNLQKLVGSSLIQEKLYSSEHCLVPKVFLEALENNQEFQNSQVLEEIKTLIK